MARYDRDADKIFHLELKATFYADVAFNPGQIIKAVTNEGKTVEVKVLSREFTSRHTLRGGPLTYNPMGKYKYFCVLHRTIDLKV